MDLFDQLKTAGPVSKASNNKSSSSDEESIGKESSDLDKDVDSIKQKSAKKNAESHSKHNLSSLSKDSEKNQKKISSQETIFESSSKKDSSQEKYLENSPTNIFSSSSDLEDSPKKISSHSKDFEVTPKKSSSSHCKNEETSYKKISSRDKSLEPNPRKTSSSDKEVENCNKKKSLHGNDVENIKLKASPHDKEMEHNNKKYSSPSKEQKVTKCNDKHKTDDTNSSPRRESIPSPVSHDNVIKKKAHKSRSLSPPPVLKSLKVKVERKKMEEFITRPHSGNVKSKQQDKHSDKQQQDKHKDIKQQDAKEPKKMTPTKAQQKLFEPSVRQKKTKSQILKEFNVKPCHVLVRRDNFKKMMREFKRNKSSLPKPSKPVKLSLDLKRTASSSKSEPESPPIKKSKLISPPKVKANFFIKLNSSKLDKSKSDKMKSEKKTKFPSKTPSSSSSSSSVAQHNKIKNSKFIATTTPTKFTRSHLISSFGRRWFQSYIRVEKCDHPLMLTFESNARARRLQSKRNKSKNLSVSFREQVEVFGSSSDSDDSYDEDFCAIPTTARNGRRPNTTTTNVAIPVVPATPIVMPARLKKVENGKVVDDIELDPSLFLDPQNLVASTPFSPGRKKRDHKSFSPLKDEGSPSPRKEQLKLANERIPPSGLRRLNMEDDDDEDDDCEYIVPIELPQRRSSRTSSTNTTDDGVPPIVAPTFDDDAVVPYNTAIFTEIDEAITIAKGIVSPATIAPMNTNTAHNKSNESDQSESHESFKSADDYLDKDGKDRPMTPTSFPSLSLSDDALNHVTNFSAAPSLTQSNNVSEVNGNVDRTIISTNNADTVADLTMNDMSMNLFIEDSETNEDDSPERTFVDSIISETIDKLGKDIGCDDSTANDQQYTNAI